MALSDAYKSTDPEEWHPPQVLERSDHLHGDDLRQLRKVVTGCLGLIGESLYRIFAILCWRGLYWLKYSILHSLFSAWLLAGLGWGALIGFGLWLGGYLP